MQFRPVKIEAKRPFKAPNSKGKEFPRTYAIAAWLYCYCQKSERVKFCLFYALESIEKSNTSQILWFPLKRLKGVRMH